LGQNLVLDARFSEGKNDRFPKLAADLIALKPDVIVANSTPAAVAAMRATATIPIVIVNVSDPVGSGLVASLAHPRGNITGSVDYANELPTKWLEFLRALAPQATRVAVLMSDNPVHPVQLKAVEKAAEQIRLTVLPTMVKSPEELEAVFASVVHQNAKALVVLGGEPFSTAGARDKMI